MIVRQYFIDYGKTFSIFFIMLFHMDLHITNIQIFGMSFAIPFFFACSGYLAYERIKKSNFLEYGIFNLRKLLLPYLFFGAIYFFSYLIFYFLTHSEKTVETIRNFLTTYPSGNIVPLWFLPALFITAMVSYIAYKSGLKIIFILIGIFIFLTIAYIKPQRDYFDILRALYAFIFFFAGLLIRASNSEVYIKSIRFPIRLIIGLALTIIGFIFAIKFVGVSSFYHFDAGKNPLLCLITAFVVIIGMCMLFSCMKSNIIIEWISKNTLLIFAMHIICYSFIRMFANFFLDFGKLSYFCTISIYVIGTLFICFVLKKSYTYVLSKISNFAS